MNYELPKRAFSLLRSIELCVSHLTAHSKGAILTCSAQQISKLSAYVFRIRSPHPVVLDLTSGRPVQNW